MTNDRYPTYLLVPRIFEVIGFSIAVMADVVALAVMIHDVHAYQLASVLGVFASAVAIYLEYRQRNIYASNATERSILGGEIQIRSLTAVAKLRHNCVQASNVVVIIVGLLIAAIAAVFGVPS